MSRTGELNLSIVPLAEEWIFAMNAHDVKRMMSLLTEDAVAEEVPENEPRRGRKSIGEAYREVFEGYPDCNAKILNQIIGSDQALIEVSFKATNKGSFRGSPATNKPIDLRIAYILKAEKGKISHITEYYDLVTLLIQQGAFPK
jgi:steroid delta-isomerase-like uncharacterized protein